ncbi:MAG: CDP-alcohol phosphatidyltransferase family protein [Oscillospiraceae bacterium]|nr:CDP-alcohol phosphatidyltransferase family protein [Oscillospiraceae bacterium]
MANTITFFRIAVSVVLLFCPAFSPAFSGFYLAAGLSDVLDGFVARKTDTVSELGARLDTAADFVFVGICLIRLLPILRISAWLYGWIGMIALIKVVNIITGFVVQRRFAAVHSRMNKATGALLFLLPLTIPAVPLQYAAVVVCAAATVAAIQEGHFIRTGRAWQPRRCGGGTGRKRMQK